MDTKKGQCCTAAGCRGRVNVIELIRVACPRLSSINRQSLMIHPSKVVCGWLWLLSLICSAHTFFIKTTDQFRSHGSDVGASVRTMVFAHNLPDFDAFVRVRGSSHPKHSMRTKSVYCCNSFWPSQKTCLILCHRAVVTGLLRVEFLWIWGN